MCCYRYGVASISRLLKIITLFCIRVLLQRLYSAKETYHFKEPTYRRRPIWVYVHMHTSAMSCLHIWGYPHTLIYRHMSEACLHIHTHTHRHMSEACLRTHTHTHTHISASACLVCRGHVAGAMSHANEIHIISSRHTHFCRKTGMCWHPHLTHTHTYITQSLIRWGLHSHTHTNTHTHTHTHTHT